MRTLITPVVIAALIVTGLATAPARAAENDAAKVLAGLAALAAIGIVIDRRNDRKKEEEAASTTTRADAFRHYDTDRWRYNDDRRYRYDAPTLRRDNGRRGDGIGKQRKKRSVRYALPSRCLRTFETRRGDRDLYGARCLRRNNDRLASLPERCERRAVTDRGVRIAYSPRCLADAGFFRVRG